MVDYDWKNLGFDYYKTEWNARYTFEHGAWSEMQLTRDEFIHMHMSTSCLHYGLELFEGLKAFRGVDGQVRLFRVEENTHRLQDSARRMCLPVPTDEMIINACIEVVKRNLDYVPPYGSGAAFYLRPVMFGTTVSLGVKPSDDALLIIFGSPVGPYFKEGIKPISAVVDRTYDRAAPRGTGHVKVGGNYASGMKAKQKAHDDGYSGIIFLDALEHKYIEECGAANFFGIKNGRYVTPDSPSVLPSVTNKSLRQLARDLGLEVEDRPIAVEELSTFEECGACGTAAAILPIGRIHDAQTDQDYTYGNEVGTYTRQLYDALQDIQYGRVEDRHGWCTLIR